MPTFEIAAADGVGGTFSGASTRWVNPGGRCSRASPETWTQAMARSAYTLAKLYIRVTANALTGASTVTSRVDTAAGAQSATIALGTTGTFEDTTNSDAIAAGSVFNTQVVVGAGGANALTVTIIGYTLAHATANDFILICSPAFAQEQWAIGIVFVAIGGRREAESLEASAAYLFRAAATLSNLRTFINTNTTSADETLATRKNGGAGAQSVTITGGVTGAFEDTTNADTVVAGDKTNYTLSAETGAGDLLDSYIEMKCISTHRPRMATGQSASITADRYLCVDGALSLSATEGPTQLAARSSFTAANLFTNVNAHGLSSGVNLFLRVDGANSALTVTVPDSTTGDFEDTTNSVAIVSGNLYNWFADHGGGAGGVTFASVSFGGGAPASGRSRVVMIG
ncbi:MAG: hypothetical protein U1B30_15700 [Pseudomonadota bacterium]|nr:hypothetical protein [Pseudomonadota bacterium]